jgi:hypothetical protein
MARLPLWPLSRAQFATALRRRLGLSFTELIAEMLSGVTEPDGA